MNWKQSAVALLCSCAAVPAFAQDAPPPAAPVVAPTGDDIIVTAQRRNERLRDVPISITALDQDTLQKSGVTTSLDIARLTPGVQLTQYGLEVQPSIRGISGGGTGVGNSTNVAFYIDGVYQPNSNSELVDLPDVQRVEVLKGPQGTYYGQNAAGGAIIIHTMDPQFKWQGRMSASYGNYHDLAFRGYVTGPISDTLAIGLAGGYEDKDAFRYNIVYHDRGPGLLSQVIRGKLLWKPTSSFSSLFTAYYIHRHDHEIGEGVNIGPGTPLAYAYAEVEGIYLPRTTSPNETSLNTPSGINNHTYGLSLQNRWQSGIGEFSTTTSYTKLKQRIIADIDATPANLGIATPDSNNRVFIQELNFASKKFNGLTINAGVFYMNSKEDYVPQVFYGNSICPTQPPGGPCEPTITQFPVVPPPDFTLGVFGYNHKDSYAAYIAANYDVTPKLNVSVSGRYSYEKQHVGTFKYFTVMPPPGAKAEPDQRGPFHFSKFTPSASIRYAITDRANVYFSYSQGFKSGFVSSADAKTSQGWDGVPPVAPENVTAYELGFKGRVLPNLNVDAAVFHYDWKNMQVFFYDPPTGFFQNAASSRINGFDFDFALKVSRELTLSGGGAYLDAKFKKYPHAAAYEPRLPTCFPGSPPVCIPGFGYVNTPVNANGTPLLNTAKYSGNVAIDYDTQLSAGELTAYVSVAFMSKVRFDVIGLTGSKAHTTLNGEIGFAPAAIKGMRLVLWGKNLGNVHYIVSNIQTAYGLMGTYGAPRQFGGRVEFKF